MVHTTLHSLYINPRAEISNQLMIGTNGNKRNIYNWVTTKNKKYLTLHANYQITITFSNYYGHTYIKGTQKPRKSEMYM